MIAKFSKNRPETLKPGRFVLCEGLFIGHVTRPRKITKVSGSRLYFTNVHDEEKYCNVGSIRFVGDDFEEAMALCLFIATEKRKIGDAIRTLEERLSRDLASAINAKMTKDFE